MENKIASIHANLLWTLVLRPSSITPHHIKWIYNLKMDANGKIILYKSILSHKGMNILTVLILKRLSLLW